MRHLLIDHPALPIPAIIRSCLGREQPPALNEAMLGHKDRLRCAAQALALSALLTEFEMWLPLRAVRNACVVDQENGKQVIVGSYPTSLSRVYNRLGGGEAAARQLRDATVRTVCERFRISRPEEIDEGAQGFFLDPVLANILQGLRLPLDRDLGHRQLPAVAAHFFTSQSHRSPRLDRRSAWLMSPSEPFCYCLRCTYLTAIIIGTRSPCRRSGRFDGAAHKVGCAAPGMSVSLQKTWN